MTVVSRQSSVASQKWSVVSRVALVTSVALLTVGAELARPRVVDAQTINAESVYKESCAQCHDNPPGRTPLCEALKDRSADAILSALTSGSMQVQGLTLSIAERRALAEH